MSIHKILLRIWHTCQTDVADNTEMLMAAMDADAADANPSLRQKIRARKVTDMLESADAAATQQHLGALRHG